MQVTIGASCWDGERRKSIIDNTKGITLDNQMKTKIAIFDSMKTKIRRMNDPKLKAIIGYGIPIMLLLHGLPPFGLTSALASSFAPSPEAVPAMAMGDSLKSTILHAFDPLINLIQSIAYPIAGVMIAGGCLFIMVGNREKGMQMLQNAAIGYILVQLSPMLLKLLVGIGNSM